MKKFKFLDERKFRFICQGLTLDSKDMGVLDHALAGLDRIKGIPSKILQHNQKCGFWPPPIFKGPQVIVSLDKTYSPKNGKLTAAPVAEHKDIVDMAPALHINLRSPSLDIPQRVEIPLRFVMKGLPKIESTYMVYLHALQMEDDATFVYYGITKRGWMKRFNEHMSNALRKHSRLLFPETLREGIMGRMIQLHGPEVVDIGSDPAPKKIMVGNYHVVCAAGLDEHQAMATEEYLVEKYSFGLPTGLNMIPGGKAGIAYLHRLNVLPTGRPVVLDEDREQILDSYLKDHPRKGLPNPLIAKLWKNDDYAVQIICSGERRLTVGQVQEIRRYAAEGMNVKAITRKVGARNERQVQNVIEGRTYARIY